MTLVRPAAAHLPGYVAALETGWAPDTVRLQAAALEQLASIAADPAAFLALMDDPQALGPPVTLADGSQVPRLPSLTRWMWDEEGFAGSINLRWMPGHAPLPPHVLGHIGYTVVPSKWRRGYATRALGLLLPLAREQGMQHVEITSDIDNVASHRVILSNGGVMVGEFDKGPVYGNKRGVRFRVALGGMDVRR